MAFSGLRLRLRPYSAPRQLGADRQQAREAAGPWPDFLGLEPRLVDLEPLTKLKNLERLSLMDNPVTKAANDIAYIMIYILCLILISCFVR